MPKQQLNNCEWLSICGNDLMTYDWTYITEEIYKTLCSDSCPNKKVCWPVINLANKGKRDVAVEYLSRYSK